MDTLFFVFSKIVQFCIEPLNWVVVFTVLSLIFLGLRKPHLCKRFLLFALVDLLVVGWLPSSGFFLRALEDAAPKLNATQLSQVSSSEVGGIGGILILGGAVEAGEISIDRGEVSIGAAAERVTKAFELIRKYPNLPFIFSGFSGSLSPRGISEAEAFKRLVVEQGLPEDLAHYENRSRNTYENVLYMKPIIGEFGQKNADGTAKPWLLITSASHMYRSLKIFQKQGIDVIPLPVDYQTGNRLNWGSFDLIRGAQQWSNFLHEAVGLMAYWITGKID